MRLRSLVDPESVAYLKNASDDWKEYDRKVRTVVRGISVFMRSLALVNPLRHSAIAEQHGIPYADLMGSFRREIKGFGSPFIDWNGHSGPKAHRIVAEQIIPFIREMRKSGR